ncbi:glycosyl transferase, family 2 [Oxalobacteraceae bacterium IMCC9480]|nr:glycosyl transferase, family 2 [Oxalobacteraceae bacterium IMCC9480]
MSARHWSRINEVGYASGMRLLFCVHRWLGRWPFRCALYPVLLWYVLTRPAARRASQDYLRHVGIDAGWGGVLRHFGAFAETILDKMLLWSGDFDASAVQYHGLGQMQQLVGQRRGALLICSHLGNLDMCRVLSRQHAGLRMTVLVHTRHAQAFNRMLGQLDPRSQLDLLQVTEVSIGTAMLLSERMARGELVVIAGDRVPVASGPRITSADFFGQPAAFPIGPYVLAHALQCPVYLLFALQRAGRPEVHIELFSAAVRLPRKERDAALATLAGQYAARLEHHCRRAPLQWCNFYDFWQDHPTENADASR